MNILHFTEFTLLRKNFRTRSVLTLNTHVLHVFSQIELKSVLRNINAFLSNMLSCVNEIQNFMFEMINDEWEQFKSETHRATCVKTITDAHMSFLESITKCMEDGSVVSKIS